MSGRPANCYRCRVKNAQYQGLCRSCGREVGIYTMTTLQQETARQMARQEQRRQLQRATPRPAPNRTVVIEGIEYAVVFDGKQSLLPEYGR